MKSSRHYVRGSKLETVTCNRCGAAAGPLKLYWHQLSCIPLHCNPNLTDSACGEPSPELQNTEEMARSNDKNIEDGVDNVMIGATKGKEMEVQCSIPAGVLSSQLVDSEGVERQAAAASVNALPESKPLECKAKVEEGRESNARPRDTAAETGDYAAVLRYFQRAVPGEPAMPDRNANELISCLRDAFQRRDFWSVAGALRCREERFMRKEKVMANELQATKRELDELRETEGKKLEEVQRKFQEALFRELECHNQCEVLRERYEDLAELHRQTKEKLDACLRRCEALLRRERAAQEKLEGLREICGEAFNGEREARKKLTELERKCKNELERVRATESEALGRGEHDFMQLKSSMEGVCNGVQPVEAGEGKFVQGMECTPCPDACTTKPVADGIELPDERGDRVRKVLFSSGRELGHDSRLLSPPNCDGSSSRVMDLDGSSWAPCTPDAKCQTNVGVGPKLADVSSFGSILLPGKGGGDFSRLSPCIPANDSSHQGQEICKNGALGNSIPNQMVPELVMGVERVSDETKGNATNGETHRMEVARTEEQVADGVDIARVEKDPYAAWIEEEPHDNSTVVPNGVDIARVEKDPITGSCFSPLVDEPSADPLTTNECSRSEVKTGAQRSVGLTKHVPIVISDSDSDGESRGASLTEKARISSCGMKTHSIQTTQRAETESQNRANLTGSNPVDADSDHGKERFIQRTAKSKRGLQNAVISDSESNTSEAAFSCKRRKAKPSSLETETVHANECGMLDKQDLLDSIGPRNLYESYHEAPKEGEPLKAICERYGCTRTGGNLREDEDWGRNEEGECAPGVKFRRLRRVKEVNEHNSQELCNKHTCPVEEGECLPVIKFRRLRRVKENEFHNLEQAKEWSIEEGEHVDGLKIKKFQGVDEGNDLHTEEQCKDGKVATVSGKQDISFPDLNVTHSDKIIYTSDSRHSKDGRSPRFASHENGAASIQFAEVSPGPTARFSHIPATSHSKERGHIQRISSNKTLDSANCKKKTEGFRKGEKQSFIKEREDTEVERCRSGLRGNKLDQYSIANSSDKLKAINLLKDSDGEDEEDEVGGDSEGESLGGFIVDEVDESGSGIGAEGLNRSKRDTSNTLDLNVSAQNLDSDRVSGSSSSETMLSQILRKLSRRSENMPNWQYEADMLAAFAKDPVLCMKAICALYRQQTNEEQSGKSSLYINGRGFDSLHALRGSLLAEFLTDGDPVGPMQKSLEEFENYDSKGVQFCRNLAFHHSKQLFEIYQKQEDPHFPSG